QAPEAVAQPQTAVARANVLILPNFTLGATYVDHEGNIQRTEGNVIKVNRNSLFVGGGPSLTLSMTDALFAPLVARQILTATQARARRINDETLLALADAYFALL